MFNILYPQFRIHGVGTEGADAVSLLGLRGAAGGFGHAAPETPAQRTVRRCGRGWVLFIE